MTNKLVTARKEQFLYWCQGMRNFAYANCVPKMLCRVDSLTEEIEHCLEQSEVQAEQSESFKKCLMCGKREIEIGRLCGICREHLVYFD